MIEEKGDLFDYIGKASAICITTNGDVKKNGEAVMGRGCALQAKEKYGSAIAISLGSALKSYGNIPQVLGSQSLTRIVSFPVKHHWHEAADLELIKNSAQLLKKMVEEHGWEKVIIPRPGCGNGKLSWDKVKEAIEPILGSDDRFVVVTNEEV